MLGVELVLVPITIFDDAIVDREALSTCRLCAMPGRKKLIQYLGNELNVTKHLEALKIGFS